MECLKLMFPQRPCPVCGAKNTEKLYTQKFPAGFNVAPLTEYDVVCCLNCGMAYADNIPSQEAFNEYYSRFSNMQDHINDHLASEEYDSVVPFIEKQFPNKKTVIVDLGCGAGVLLEQLQHHDYRNLTGVEISSPAVKDARAKGLKIVEACIGSLQLETPADVVMLMNVIEHCVDLQPVLDCIRSILRPGGFVVVGVPDVKFFSTNIGGPFHEFSVQHINYFNINSICNLLGGMGFVDTGNSYAYEDGSFYVLQQTMEKLDIKPDFSAKGILETYIADSVQWCHLLRAKVENLNTKYIVYGTGSFTLTLLGTGVFMAEEIICFSDINEAFWGKEYMNKPVVPPHELQNWAGDIIISSRVSQKQIQKYLVETLGLKKKLITLY